MDLLLCKEFVKVSVFVIFDLNQNYQDETQHRNADYISAMEQQMKDMAREEEELQSIIIII